jgi:hypothetical protein
MEPSGEVARAFLDQHRITHAEQMVDAGADRRPGGALQLERVGCRVING